MTDLMELGTDEQTQALRELVHLGLGSAIVNICNSLEIDGGWLENFVLDEMRIGNLGEKEIAARSIYELSDARSRECQLALRMTENVRQAVAAKSV